MSAMPDNRPVIVLVRPQLGENIGKAARAMLNFGLVEMRLVAPRDGWPNPSAGPAAAGADVVLERAEVFETLADAVADCAHVYATTVRKRGLAQERLDQLISGIQRQVETSGEGEVPSSRIGEMVMEGLRQLDSVAYIRFASVYRDFSEARDFEEFASSVQEMSGHDVGNA